MATAFKDIKKGDVILSTLKGNGRVYVVTGVGEMDERPHVCGLDARSFTACWSGPPDEEKFHVVREAYVDNEEGVVTPGGLYDTLFRTTEGQWVMYTVPVNSHGCPHFRPMGEWGAQAWLSEHGPKPDKAPVVQRPYVVVRMNDGMIQAIDKTPGLPDFEVIVVEYDDHDWFHPDDLCPKVHKDLDGDLAFWTVWSTSDIDEVSVEFMAHLKRVEQRIELGLSADESKEPSDAVLGRAVSM